MSVDTFTSSGTWTVPTGVTSVDIECGGCSGDGGTKTIGNTGGGGGGGYAKATAYAVTPGDVWTVTVGTHGVGVNTKIFKGMTTACEAGYGVTADGSGTGGAGGAGVTGDVQHTGGNGGTASTAGGGGGGGAGTTGNGGNGSGGGAGGTGGTGGGGAGGAGEKSPSACSAGVVGSGGAAGGGGGRNTGGTGCAGKDGWATFTYTAAATGTPMKSTLAKVEDRFLAVEQ